MSNTAALFMLGDPYWTFLNGDVGEVITLVDAEANTLSDRSPKANAIAGTTPSISSSSPLAELYSPLFNGTSEYYTLGSATDWKVGGVDSLFQYDDWTIEAKFRCDALTSPYMVICSTRSQNAGAQGGVEIGILPTGEIFVGVYADASTVTSIVSAAGVISIGTDYEVLVCLDDQLTLHLFLNGAEDSGSPVTLTATMGEVYVPMYVGANNVAGTIGQYFSGRIELRITNGVQRYAGAAYTVPATWIAG